MAAQTLVGMIPGVGAIAGPLAGKLTSSLLNEAVAETAAMEASVFGHGEALGEVANTEIAHEAALTEVLASQAAEAATEGEAEATLAASLPLTITIMGARRSARRVTPVLARATSKLVKTIRRHGGPAGRNILRTIPTIQPAHGCDVARRPPPRHTGHRAACAAARWLRIRSACSPIRKSSIARSRATCALRKQVAPPHSHRGLGGRMCPRCLGIRRAFGDERKRRLSNVRPQPPRADGPRRVLRLARNGRSTSGWQSRAINLDRHAKSLRNFDKGEFGTGPASPSEAHVEAANRFVSRFREKLIERSRWVERGGC